jgi:hypothetical protein
MCDEDRRSSPHVDWGNAQFGPMDEIKMPALRSGLLIDDRGFHIHPLKASRKKRLPAMEGSSENSRSIKQSSVRNHSAASLESMKDY